MISVIQYLDYLIFYLKGCLSQGLNLTVTLAHQCKFFDDFVKKIALHKTFNLFDYPSIKTFNLFVVLLSFLLLRNIINSNRGVERYILHLSILSAVCRGASMSVIIKDIHINYFALQFQVL